MTALAACNEAVLAIDAGGTYFKSALVTAGGEIPKKSRLCIRVDSNGDKQSIKDAYQTIIRIQRAVAGKLGKTIAGIVVDTPGPFDFTTGTSLMKHKFAAIYEIPLKPWIQEASGPLPILFLHDSTAFLLGESWKGEARGYGDVAGVMLGTGLGFACMKNGEMCLNPSGGPEISLYNRQFLGTTAEELISRRGIMRDYMDRAACGESQAPDVLEISLRARAGDKTAAETFTRTGRYLGQMLSSVLLGLGTRCLVVGGQIAKSFDLFEEGLKAELKHVASLEKVARSGQPDDAHLLGCAKAFWGRRGQE